MRVGLIAVSSQKWVTLSLHYLYSNSLPILKKDDLQLIEFPLTKKQGDIIKELKKENFDIVCFSIYVWNEERIYSIISKLKNGNRRPLIVVGGPSTYDAETTLMNNPNIDVAVRGEGEITLKNILQNKGKFMNVLGVSYRIKDKLIHNPPQPLVQNLDELESPFKAELQFPFHKKFMYNTSRGCNYRCSFCVEGCSAGFRSFSLERVKKDLEIITNRSSEKMITIGDAYFNRNNSFLKEFLFNVKNKLPKFSMVAEINVNKVNKETIKLLKRLNVERVETGPQSISTKCLKEIHRSLDKEKFKTIVKSLEKEDIKVICDLILGLPKDNLKSFKKSLDYLVREVRPYQVSVLKLRVLPGTEIYNNTKKWNIKFSPKNEYRIISSRTFPEEDIKKAEEHVKRILGVTEIR